MKRNPDISIGKGDLILTTPAVISPGVFRDLSDHINRHRLAVGLQFWDCLCPKVLELLLNDL